MDEKELQMILNKLFEGLCIISINDLYGRSDSTIKFQTQKFLDSIGLEHHLIKGESELTNLRHKENVFYILSDQVLSYKDGQYGDYVLNKVDDGEFGEHLMNSKKAIVSTVKSQRYKSFMYGICSAADMNLKDTLNLEIMKLLIFEAARCKGVKCPIKFNEDVIEYNRAVAKGHIDHQKKWADFVKDREQEKKYLTPEELKEGKGNPYFENDTDYLRNLKGESPENDKGGLSR